eukprot:TRINITY_DN3406_c0_g1_i1.p1 TRINITY_DN3406_c0_g1~~TRINITY_DN3406_c0_g1_i1.p1  ORF type:complete len:164 (+),score=43.60 TRINITY_DN3406_c0_g1_i1:549-1040(+)
MVDHMFDVNSPPHPTSSSSSSSSTSTTSISSSEVVSYSPFYYHFRPRFTDINKEIHSTKQNMNQNKKEPHSYPTIYYIDSRKSPFRSDSENEELVDAGDEDINNNNEKEQVSSGSGVVAYCGICRTPFENYLDHISSQNHCKLSEENEELKEIESLLLLQPDD